MGQSANSQVKSAVALENFRKPLLAYLISSLDNHDIWVRCLASDMLATLKDPAAIEYLRRLMTDIDEDVRYAAAKALDAIGHSRITMVSVQNPGCESCLIRLIAEEALSQGPAPGQESVSIKPMNKAGDGLDETPYGFSLHGGEEWCQERNSSIKGENHEIWTGHDIA